jgi:hypothetical protein
MSKVEKRLISWLKRRENPTSFLHLFVLFEPSVDQMMPATLMRADLHLPTIQCYSLPETPSQTLLEIVSLAI